ncbi:GyrI-like domain-containing protein [Streptococcus sp. FT1-55]|uniref:GyrI-like domain-containing protein n=1 Tax=Streptococcus sp. FT1-55 TaxID=3409805 RepID=UPI003BF4D048
MAFDFKKEFKEFYQPKTKPSIITVPKMNYLAVRGTGDPNQEDSAYKESIELLYGVAYTLKMSHETDYKIEGFFDYVVPPLEGFWWQEDREDVDYGHKEQFSFISVIRLPDFVTKDNVDWAISQASKKKKRDFSKVEFFTYDEGLCVQCMHVGPYNDEPKTVEAMHQFMEEEGYVLDITLKRMHHEIYLGDVRKTAAEKLKTGLRHPIKKNI